MPDKWEIEVFDNNFDRTYDKNTGRWTFQCSLKIMIIQLKNF